MKRIICALFASLLLVGCAPHYTKVSRLESPYAEQLQKRYDFIKSDSIGRNIGHLRP